MTEGINIEAQRAALERDRLRKFAKDILDRGHISATDAPRTLAAIRDEARQLVKAIA